MDVTLYALLVVPRVVVEDAKAVVILHVIQDVIRHVRLVAVVHV